MDRTHPVLNLGWNRLVLVLGSLDEGSHYYSANFTLFHGKK